MVWRTRVAKACAVALFAAAVLLGQPQVASGQMGQRLSIQASALRADVFGDQFSTFDAGLGFELQARYTPGVVSWGGGVQYTIHGDSEAEADGHDPDIKLLGIFVEPRYVLDIGGESAAPYLSARVAFAQFDVRVDFSDGDVLTFTSTGVTLNVGGGLLVRLGPRVNLDVGATAGFNRYQPTDGDTAFGEPFDMELGSGTNLVMRVGLAVGLGR
jgi:opacity protein-like surface antigen